MYEILPAVSRLVQQEIEEDPSPVDQRVNVWRIGGEDPAGPRGTSSQAAQHRRDNRCPESHQIARQGPPAFLQEVRANIRVFENSA